MKNITIITFITLSVIQCQGFVTTRSDPFSYEIQDSVDNDATDYVVDALIESSLNSESVSEERPVKRNSRRWRPSKTSYRSRYMYAYEAMIRKMQAASMGKPNSAVGNSVDSMKSNDTQNAEEMGTYLEGDILTLNRGGKKSKFSLWPNGVVHYSIDRSFNDHDHDMILLAMSKIQEHTCVRFTPWTKGVTDFIAINSSHSGCWSSVGMVGGAQTVNLQKEDKGHFGCFRSVGIPMHELMHVLGVIHEQNRNDRDKYVTIKWRNIKSDKKKNFNLLPKMMNLVLKYDYSSIMHYTEYAFTKNSKHTIEVKENTAAKIGQNKELSSLDIDKINFLYQCNKGKDKLKYNRVH